MSLLAPLENIAETVAKPESRSVGRLRARSVLRHLTDVKRVRGCGLALGQEMRLRGSEGSGGVSGGVTGLATCGSVWVCPVCASKIALTRTNDLEAGIRHWAGHGGSFAMLTLTIQHHKGQGLGMLWDAVSTAWRRFVRDGSATRLRKALGVNGYHRTTEVTLGANGWHVHLHVLYFVEGSVSDLMGRSHSGALVARWMHSVEAVGFRAVTDAQDWKVLQGNADALSAVAGYVTKGQYQESSAAKPRGARSVAMEMTRGDIKETRAKGSRTPFELLADIVDSVTSTGEIPVSDMALWQEWERESKGRRQQVWSRGMRARLGLDAELTDEEAAALEVDGTDVIALEASEWKRATEADPHFHADLIAALESGATLAEGLTFCADFLVRRGVRFRVVFPGMES